MTHDSLPPQHAHDMPPQEERAPSRRQGILVPAAILIAGLCIAAAILLSQNIFQNPFTSQPNENLPNFTATAPTLTPFDPATDHILGNPDAPVLIIEYSDFNCPYCQSFHTSMKQLMAEYGSTGSVAWVYRHLPIITEDSPTIAYAAECVAQAAGNDAFWKFTDTLFERPQGTHVAVAALSEIVASLDVDKTAYETCIARNPHEARIQALIDNAISLNITGTPASFAVVQGKVYPIPGGALPYAQLTQALGSIIAESKK